MSDTTTVSPPTTNVTPTPDQALSVTTHRGHIGRIVTASMLSGLVVAIVLAVGPFAGAQEHVITGAVLLAFGAAWAALAHLSVRRTDQPQRWAFAPAAAMAAAGLELSPTGNQLGWLWPPAILALVAWMVHRSRQDLRSRARVVVLYPVFAALALSAVGGASETYSESTDPAGAMPGRLVSVGDHELHINRTGTGSPTVVLEGLDGPERRRRS